MYPYNCGVQAVLSDISTHKIWQWTKTIMWAYEIVRWHMHGLRSMFRIIYCRVFHNKKIDVRNTNILTFNKYSKTFEYWNLFAATFFPTVEMLLSFGEPIERILKYFTIVLNKVLAMYEVFRLKYTSRASNIRNTWNIFELFSSIIQI